MCNWVGADGSVCHDTHLSANYLVWQRRSGEVRSTPSRLGFSSRCSSQVLQIDLAIGPPLCWLVLVGVGICLTTLVFSWSILRPLLVNTCPINVTSFRRSLTFFLFWTTPPHSLHLFSRFVIFGGGPGSVLTPSSSCWCPCSRSLSASCNYQHLCSSSSCHS